MSDETKCSVCEYCHSRIQWDGIDWVDNEPDGHTCVESPNLRHKPSGLTAEPLAQSMLEIERPTLEQCFDRLIAAIDTGVPKSCNDHDNATWNYSEASFYARAIRDAVLSPIFAEQPQLCIPGDQTPVWLLRFDDTGRNEMHFNTEQEARAAWEKYAPSWNCWLFGPLPMANTSRLRRSASPVPAVAEGTLPPLDEVEVCSRQGPLSGEWSDFVRFPVYMDLWSRYDALATQLEAAQEEIKRLVEESTKDFNDTEDQLSELTARAEAAEALAKEYRELHKLDSAYIEEDCVSDDHGDDRCALCVKADALGNQEKESSPDSKQS